MDRFVRRAHVSSRTVAVGIHGDSADSEVAARTNDTHGNLAAVRDQNLVQDEESLAFSWSTAVRTSGFSVPGSCSGSVRRSVFWFEFGSSSGVRGFGVPTKSVLPHSPDS
jgi:hypothetical protein